MTDAPTVIDSFSGEWRFLSNFAPSPWVELEGVPYATVEHAFQAAKCADPLMRQTIQRAATPTIAKKLGRHCSLRGDWGQIRISVMRDLLWQKFSPGRAPAYLAGLLRTGDALLIEGNDWGDTFWGVCSGSGSNMLGQLLMDVRAERRRRGDK